MGMLIIYESMLEFANVAVQCDRNRERCECERCLFYADCPIDEPENRMIMHGKIEPPNRLEDYIVGADFGSGESLSADIKN